MELGHDWLHTMEKQFINWLVIRADLPLGNLPVFHDGTPCSRDAPGLLTLGECRWRNRRPAQACPVKRQTRPRCGSPGKGRNSQSKLVPVADGPTSANPGCQ